MSDDNWGYFNKETISLLIGFLLAKYLQPRYEKKIRNVKVHTNTSERNPIYSVLIIFTDGSDVDLEDVDLFKLLDE